ncbi:MAG: hypothetical protein QOJ29_2153, partial [Thermoleophilaceae bacterium]|nr:hypothetical protein [Thermoleophilaceae bacterium]
MLTRASAAGCLVAALLALGAGPALARFAPTGQPPGAVLGFGVSGSSWLALVVPGSAPGAVVFGTGVPYVSHDAGATWQQVAMNGLKDPFPGVDVAVAPDGAFWLSVQDYQSAATFLMRMDRNGTAFDPVARFPSTQSTTQVSVPAWDMQEHLWAAVTSGQPRQSEVDRVAADGTIAERVPVNVENGSARRVTFVGGRLYADFGTIQIFQVRGKSATALGQSGQNTVSIGFPLLAVGKSVLTESGLSFDGGQTFASRFTAVRAVVGNDRLVRTLASFGATQADGGRILRRVSSRFFAPTALTLPTNTTFVGQARQALVAVAGGEVQLHGGAVPKLTARGHLSATARGMIARANHWRHQAGLPPMLG